MKKKTILMIVLFLAIGFAAVSKTLFINGTATYSTNKDDFNVIFTDAQASEENKTSSKVNAKASAKIESDKKHITFSTQDLAVVGEWAKVDYEITNYSKNYDAAVTVSWELEKTSDADFVEEYLDIDTVQNWTGNIEAGTRKTGYVLVSVKKAYLGSGDLNDPKEVKFKVTYKADAVSRESLGDEISDPITYEYSRVSSTSAAWSGTYGDLTTDYTTLSDWQNQPFIRHGSDNSDAVCIYINDKVECFKGNNADAELAHISNVAKEYYGDSTVECNFNDTCYLGFNACTIYWYGDVFCSNDMSCTASGTGTVDCLN